MTVEPADPRPRVEEMTILGSRCTQCGRPDAWERDRCPSCLGESSPERFGPSGVVWSSADVHLAVGHREPPFTLAQVDLDNGPRVLATVRPSGELPPGTRVEVIGQLDGDVVVGP